MQFSKNIHMTKIRLVEITGVEPATPCVQGRCSPN